MTLNGIDVSYWNGMANLGSQSFQIARATYGTSRDTKFVAHTANCRRQGKLPGAYHFGTNAPVAAQVDAFLAQVRSVNVRLVALDLEFNSDATMSNAQAAQWIAAVKAKGYTVGLYHSRSGHPQLGQGWDWVADWDATTFPPGSEMWQHQGHPLDRDKFNGTLNDLRKLAGIAVPKPPPTYSPIVQYAQSTPSERKNPMLLGAYGVSSPYVMHLAKDQPLFAHPGGPRVTRMSRAGAVTYVAKTSSKWASVIIGTAAPYQDRIVRPTGLYVPLAAGEVTER